MTRPTVSAAAADMYESLAAISAAYTSGATTTIDEQNNWILLRLCEALMGQAIQPIIDLSRDTDDGPGWSKLLDLDNGPDSAVAYQGQFVGITINPADPATTSRNLIRDRPAWKRGRPASMIAAVQATLTGSQSCVLLERDSSPYHATVQVWRAQMPDEAATRAALALNKPGPVIVDLQILDGPTYGVIRSALPTDDYVTRETEFPTYGDVREYTP